MPIDDTAGLAGILEQLRRIADSLDAPAPEPSDADLAVAEAFIWQAEPPLLRPVHAINRIDIGLLQAIAQQRQTLLDNTRRFAEGLPANNALLWGAKGMGKSSLV
ncbi:MAG: DUF815 domain-containing protein, partial [Rhodobiaceae bacterium]|nr:DUF815 domain-containing protein [Rhodobiaceae bacterium]